MKIFNTLENYTKEQLGWNTFFQQQDTQGFQVGRVIAAHKHHYDIILPEKGTFKGQLIGKLLFMADTPSELPKTGDWVLISPMDEQEVLIHEVMERETMFSRRSAGASGSEQVICTNLQTLFIVQSLNENFSPRRLERYITQAYSSQVKPVVILHKADLVADIEPYLDQLKEIQQDLSIVVTSIVDGRGVKEIQSMITEGMTFAFVGSSGVGKSSLINSLLGSQQQVTQEVSHYDSKGKHTTVSRELLFLPEGGILVDTPGMREFGVTADEEGLQKSFYEVSELAEHCRFKHCTHMHEPDCAVLQGVAEGKISEDRYQSYLKLQREAEHYQMSNHEKRKKQKQFGKMVKEVVKQKKNRR
ncbi:ribosome small subunit-dependent GTPase A [Algivirga pacifica]|uniref:ribosome small subunit-dependent GTPase A n=1 Tax=Algivirga pacifica TaxID=1162670 RepID=UPI0031EB1950